jgi:hypothetical protein
MPIGKVTVRHLEAVRKTDAFSDGLLALRCPLTDIGVAPWALVRVGDAQKFKDSVVGGETLRAAHDSVNGRGLGLYERPADSFEPLQLGRIYALMFKAKSLDRCPGHKCRSRLPIFPWKSYRR